MNLFFTSIHPTKYYFLHPRVCNDVNTDDSRKMKKKRKRKRMKKKSNEEEILNLIIKMNNALNYYQN